jgi:hypothetical protein
MQPRVQRFQAQRRMTEEDHSSVITNQILKSIITRRSISMSSTSTSASGYEMKWLPSLRLAGYVRTP